MFEELKIKIRPKMVVVKRELAETLSIFKDFNNKNLEDGKSVFTKTFGFYQNGLKFDSDKLMVGLDEEIVALKRSKYNLFGKSDKKEKMMDKDLSKNLNYIFYDEDRE